jgi:hypothetical protein
MRIEQFMPTSTTNYSQWFVNCAHVNIVGPGGGVPTGFAKFPGTYHRNDPGEAQTLNGLRYCTSTVLYRETAVGSYSTLELTRLSLL